MYVKYIFYCICQSRQRRLNRRSEHRKEIHSRKPKTKRTGASKERYEDKWQGYQTNWYNVFRFVLLEYILCGFAVCNCLESVMRLNTCKRCELAYFMFWHCDSVGLTEFLLIICWIEFEITSMYVQFVWGRGVFMLEMSALPFCEQCRFSVTNLGFCAKLSWKEDKSVCLYEK